MSHEVNSATPRELRARLGKTTDPAERTRLETELRVRRHGDPSLRKRLGADLHKQMMGELYGYNV